MSKQVVSCGGAVGTLVVVWLPLLFVGNFALSVLGLGDVDAAGTVCSAFSLVVAIALAVAVYKASGRWQSGPPPPPPTTHETQIAESTVDRLQLDPASERSVQLPTPAPATVEAPAPRPWWRRLFGGE
jgi:hypothetical protein